MSHLNKPRLKNWAENIGLEPEEALALLNFLNEVDPTINLSQDIENLKSVILDEQMDKVLRGEDEHK